MQWGNVGRTNNIVYPTDVHSIARWLSLRCFCQRHCDRRPSVWGRFVDKYVYVKNMNRTTPTRIFCQAFLTVSRNETWRETLNGELYVFEKKKLNAWSPSHKEITVAETAQVLRWPLRNHCNHGNHCLVARAAFIGFATVLHLSYLSLVRKILWIFNISCRKLANIAASREFISFEPVGSSSRSLIESLLRLSAFGLGLRLLLSPGRLSRTLEDVAVARSDRVQKLLQSQALGPVVADSVIRATQ